MKKKVLSETIKYVKRCAIWCSIIIETTAMHGSNTTVTQIMIIMTVLADVWFKFLVFLFYSLKVLDLSCIS